MIRREELFLIILSFLVTVFNIALVLLGERRIDVYIALFILVYFISLTLLGGGIGERILGKINILFIVIFILIVAYRIWRILYPESPSILDIVFGG